jgi:hypothetical protein
VVPPRFRHFTRVFPKKWLELKSLKEWTKAEELRLRGPQLLSVRPSLKAAKFLHNYEFGEDGKRTVVLKHPILKIMDS